MKQNFIFGSCFLRAHFPFITKNNWNVLPEWLFQQERQSWEPRAQLGTLVGLLLAMTGLAASAMLELTSSALSGRFGICRPPDCDPHRLGAHALAPRVRSWGDQGRKPNSAASSTWESSKKKFHRWWSVCSNDTLACLGVPGRLACGRTKSANPPSEGSCETRQLVGILAWKQQPTACCSLVEPLVKVALWIHNVIGRLACQATRMNK